MSEDSNLSADVQHVLVYEHETVISGRYSHTSQRRYRLRKDPPPTRVAGDIHTFTRKSRARLFQTMRRLRTSLLSPPLFVTLTYHHTWPEDTYGDLHAFTAWLNRRTDGAARYIWRLEWQQRGAPHYHLLIWMPGSHVFTADTATVRAIRLAWATIIGTRDDRDAMKHGVMVKQIVSFRQAFTYVAKYIAKLHPEPECGNGQRRWGRSANLPVMELYREDVSQDTHVYLRRIARRLLRSRGLTRHKAHQLASRLHHSISLDAHTVARLLNAFKAPWEERRIDPGPVPARCMDLFDGLWEF